MTPLSRPSGLAGSRTEADAPGALRPSELTAPSLATTPWHAMAPDAALAASRSSPAGLSLAEAARRLEVHGPNVIARAKGESVLALLWRQIASPLVYVLIGAAVLAIALGKVIDGLVVLGVVVLNTIIGFVQEYRAGKAIEALIDMVPESATAIRDGERVTVPAADLVPGDLVVVASGDKVPADARLLSLRGLLVNEAALTGESLPAAKRLDAVELDAALGDRLGMLYGGTLVTSGTGTAVLTATGGATELGRISALMRQTTQSETPLTRSMAEVGKRLTVVIGAVAALILVVGLLRGYPIADATLAAITLAVAAIPEGLPAIVTIALAIGVQRMARRRAVIRRLPAVETLGSTTVICSDKTGTLTRNEMTVRAVWTPAGRYEVEGVGYAPAGRVTRDGAPLHAPVEDVLDLARAGALCSDAVLRREEGSWRIDGDPTEGALVVAAAKVGFDVSAVREAWPRLDAIPFESERQYMATLHRDPEGRRVVLLKGAPEMVLKRCEGAHDGPTHEVELALERMARAGMRVLAVARRVVDEGTTALDEQLTERGFTLVGLAGMIDPPREEAMAAVADCRRAGIQVKMITGDHPETARAIGEQLGLGDGPAMTGHELARLDEAGLRRAVRDTNVFARVAPEHKLQLVRALQQEGHVVAMTGDGVNDAPALKQADIGVAMGITGTAVSREAADVVLADDNFASIAAAVEEGRRVYDNLIKALAFVLPTNLGEALIILLAVMFFPIVGGEPLLPMLPVQILWINLVATVALALPLAFEALEPNVMRRPPRDPKTPILSRFVLARTGIVALLMTAGAIGLFLYEYYGEVARGVEPALALREAQTMAVTTVVLMQVFYLLNCRSLAGSVLEIGLFTNRMVFVGIAAILALQLAFVYLPPLNALFGSAPLGPGEWVKATLVAAIVLPVIGLEKRWRRSRTEAVR